MFSPAEAAAHYEDVSGIVREASLLCAVWNDFDRSVVRQRNGDGTDAVFSVVDAGDIFSFAAVTKNLSISYWQNFGGVFTGIGILGTFIGLTIGLHGVDLTSSDVGVLKEGIANLLDGVSIAFVTSLMGILGALVYGAFHQYFLGKVQRAVTRFAARIEELYPRRSAEQWLAESHHESCKQTLALQNLSQDMAESLAELLESQMSSAFEELCSKFTDGMTPLFEKLYTAVDELNSGGASTIADMMSKSAGAQLEAFGEALSAIPQAVQANMDASHQMTQAAHQEMRQAMEEMRQSLVAGAEEATQKQREAAQEMAARIEQFGTALQHGSADAEKRLAALHEAAGRTQEQMGAMTRELHRTLTEHNRVMADTYSKFAEIAGGFNSLLAQVKDSETALQKAVAPLLTANAALQKEAERVRADAQKAQQQMAEQLKALGAQGQKTEANIGALVKGMEKSEKQIASAWKLYGERFDKIGKELNEATDTITERLSEYNAVMNEGMKAQLSEFDKSMSNAVGSLSEAIVELGELVEAHPHKGGRS